MKPYLYEDVVARALSFLDVVEIGNNAGFSNKKFQDDMEAIGWRTGMPWCAFFVMNIYTQIYGRQHVRFMHPNVREMFKRASQYELLPGTRKVIVTDTPVPGAVVCWGVGKNTGHCGIVTRVFPDGTFLTVEGNTSGKRLSRNGDGIYLKERKLKLGTWQTLGFFYLDENNS